MFPVKREGKEYWVKVAESKIRIPLRKDPGQ
jgi:hypothetical protein